MHEGLGSVLATINHKPAPQKKKINDFPEFYLLLALNNLALAPKCLCSGVLRLWFALPYDSRCCISFLWFAGSQLSLLFVHNIPILFFLVNFENLCVWLQVLYQICKLQRFSYSLKYFQSLNINLFFLSFWDRISICSPGWSGKSRILWSIIYSFLRLCFWYVIPKKSLLNPN